MTDGLKIVVVPVKDLDAGKAFYTALLGVEPLHDAPYYVGYETAGLHLGLNPHGHEQGMTGPTYYWKVADLATASDALVAAGGSVLQEPSEVGPGRTVATVADSDGNVIGLVQDA
ncbi:VOC family protein [Cellulomonas sp. URHD0024]|uniref:VOC family protein n=1 Tax=Cellulomonas sp. URHD0024 TaxID=1302620 RepID=UPI00041C3B2C|nr:VOC family protein [Cellulomonas sp. URHD0024]